MRTPRDTGGTCGGERAHPETLEGPVEVNMSTQKTPASELLLRYFQHVGTRAAGCFSFYFTLNL